MSTVFDSLMDLGAYRVQVVSGDDPYLGILSVTDTSTNEVIHEENVGIAFGAPFGPDVDDVMAWQERAADVVDHPERRTP